MVSAPPPGGPGGSRPWPPGRLPPLPGNRAILRLTHHGRVITPEIALAPPLLSGRGTAFHMLHEGRLLGSMEIRFVKQLEKYDSPALGDRAGDVEISYLDREGGADAGHRGVGSSLVALATEWAVGRGALRLTHYAVHSHVFWDKMGFRPALGAGPESDETFEPGENLVLSRDATEAYIRGRWKDPRRTLREIGGLPMALDPSAWDAWRAHAAAAPLLGRSQPVAALRKQADLVLRDLTKAATDPTYHAAFTENPDLRQDVHALIARLPPALAPLRTELERAARVMDEPT